MKPKYTHTPVDYSKENKDRRKMTNYLRTGNFKKVAGSKIHGRLVKKRRIILAVIASVIFIIGMCYVIG